MWWRFASLLLSGWRYGSADWRWRQLAKDSIWVKKLEVKGLIPDEMVD